MNIFYGRPGATQWCTPQHEKFYPGTRRTAIYQIAFAYMFWGAQWNLMDALTKRYSDAMDAQQQEYRKEKKQ